LSSEAEAPAEEAAPAAIDERYAPLLETLRSELGDAVLAAEMATGDVVIRVRTDAWRRAVQACRDRLGLTYFCFLSGIDWMAAPDLSGEKVWDPDGSAGTAEGDEMTPTEPDSRSGWTTGVAGGETRFQVFCRLYSVESHLGLTLKADLDEATPTVESITEVYRGADWHEREAWEMYGFDFTGHPSLRHLYLPGEFEGFPLRKDFPLLAREVKPWPGLVDVEPLPGEEAGDGEGTEGGDG
jgi:NADH-quinone oxidoreductase subunit C